MVLRFALAAVLVFAALGKLRDRRVVAARLGLGATVAAVLAEGAVGVWLASGLAPGAAGAAAALLFALFTVWLLRRRAAGARRLPCACFGAGPERPTWLLATRAGALALLAAVVAWSPATPARETAVAIAVALLVVAVAALTVLVLALYRQVGLLTLRLGPRSALELAEEGPELGRDAPTLDGLGRAGSELVAFIGEGCPVCHDLEPSLRALAREGIALRLVVDVDEPDVIERWEVPGTPFVVVVEDGIVAAKGTVNTLEEIEGLIDRARARVAYAAA